jgi:hypothetical protein
LRFLLPTLIGNTIGGVALVAFLNHAPLAPELQEDATDRSAKDDRKAKRKTEIGKQTKVKSGKS